MKRSAWILGTLTMMVAPAFAEQPRTVLAPVKLVDLRQAPLSPSVLTEGKKDDAAVLLLRAAARERASADTLEALLERQKARDAALMNILGPDSAVTKAFAKALAEKLSGLFAGNVAPQNAPVIAMQMVQSIFLNRRDDMASVQDLYRDDAWRQTIRARLAKGDNPELNVMLKPEKREELKNTALYIHTPGKADGKIEPAVHLILTALAQQIGHAALAEITHPGAPVYTLFQESLAKALPNDPAAKAWLDDWLYLREGRALAVVSDFRPDGELMQEAVTQSEGNRRARLPDPPAIAVTEPK